MSHYRNFANGGFVFLLAATHVGCAGSGLKNIFTRNETDGYHSIDELEAEERKLAEAEESGSEEQSRSIAARMTSWRPFSKPDANQEEEYAAYASDPSDADSEETEKSANPFSRAFAKRDTVGSDPFLEAEATSTKREDAESGIAARNPQTAKLADKSASATKKGKSVTAEDELVVTPESKAKSGKDAKVAAIKATEKSDSDSTDAEDDDALAKRFEQHFLLNSAGTIARTEAADNAAGTAEKLKKKASTIVASTESKQRDISSLAEKQIDAFDYLLGTETRDKSPASKRRTDAEPLQAARRRDVAYESTTNSLAAFDSLVGAEIDNAKRAVIEAGHTVAQEVKRQSAAVDINVADAESLFGAAAARQNSRESHPAAVKTARTSDKQINDSEFNWNEPSESGTGFEKGNSNAQTTGGPVVQRQPRTGEDRESFRNTAFGAPPATAGNIDGDDCSIVETAESLKSVKTAFASHNRDLTARSGRSEGNVVIHPAATETSMDGDVHFTAAPVAPIPQMESTVQMAASESRTGLIQSLSLRNWMLLIGGIVVIALLFAPGRTKPVTMSGRTANG